MMKIIGLTGGIASGKSTVAKFFQRLGAKVINADNIYKELSKPGKILYNKIISEFSGAIVGPDYTIDWQHLAAIVFNDDIKRKRLNDITHPEIKRAIGILIDKYRMMNEPYIVIEVPLLFESGYNTICDETIVVTVNPDVQIRRLMNRNNIDKQTALKMINAQMPLTEKSKLSTYIIDNSADLSKTETQFYDILDQIKR
ncbi:MAG: dephospho-CoA kinase [Candidatus Izemoplasmatales bacterium]|nr:dephospho-CoA kinase [Candidatus Izemoplasmatales bacterium]MDD3865875.1 dephospho-CoA kinase [Candidatus Izemoplasmatales bacterium]